jgi:hypothetical protein
MTRVTGRNELTLHDIALFPFVEIVQALRENEMINRMLDGYRLDGLWAWFDKIDNEPWVQRVKPPAAYITN